MDGLTDFKIRNLHPRKDRYEVPDGKGLFIRVSPTGHKSWIYRYRFGEQQTPRRMTLGSYPRMTLAQARERHGAAMQAVEKGIDPGAKAKDEKVKRKSEPTFKDLLDEYWLTELSKSQTGSDRRRLVEKDALPRWSSRKVSSIKRRDAVILLDGVRDRAPVTANRLHGVLVRMFNFAAERGIIDFSPLIGMRRGKESSRSRVLTDDEIKMLWGCLDLENTEIDIYRPTKLAIKAILLTGQRPGEIAGMTWDEINDEWWTIPAERSKNGEENRVPLLPMFRAILEQAKAYGGTSAFLFPSPHSPLYGFKKPKKAKPGKEDISITVGSMANGLRRHREIMKVTLPFTPHDLRRTVRTRLAELGIADVTAERVLGHKLQGVLGIYNRHSYDAEKRHALALWEKRLNEIIGKSEPASNIIPLEVRRG